MEDYYQVLEVTQDVTQDLIHKAYKRLALLHHPDKNPRNAEDATETFQLLGRAYATLKDENKRREYDFQQRWGSHSAGESTPFPTTESTSQSRQELSRAELMVQINRRKATRALRWQKTKTTCENEIEELRKEITHIVDVIIDGTNVETRGSLVEEMPGKQAYLQFLELDIREKEGEFEAQNEVDDLLLQKMQRMKEKFEHKTRTPSTRCCGTTEHLFSKITTLLPGT